MVFYLKIQVHSSNSKSHIFSCYAKYCYGTRTYVVGTIIFCPHQYYKMSNEMDTHFFMKHPIIDELNKIYTRIFILCASLSYKYRKWTYVNLYSCMGKITNNRNRNILCFFLERVFALSLSFILHGKGKLLRNIDINVTGSAE